MTRNYEMVRKEKQLPEEEAQAILRDGEYGVLSMCGEDGCAYGVPLNYAYEGGCIYFHCALQAGRKLDCIRENNQVCFTVVGKTQVVPGKFSEHYQSAMAFGKVCEVPAGRKAEALMTLIDKYSSEFREEGIRYIERAKEKTGVYEIRIETITGKGSRR